MICLGYLYAIGYGTEMGEAVRAEVNTGIFKRAMTVAPYQPGRERRLAKSYHQFGKGCRDCSNKIDEAIAKRLSPEKIIKADDPNLKPKDRATRLWENPTIRKQTAVCIADSTKVLAVIWAAAWKNGNGNAIAASSLKKMDKQKLIKAYRTEKILFRV
jgi:hypothetical protein